MDIKTNCLLLFTYAASCILIQFCKADQVSFKLSGSLNLGSFPQVNMMPGVAPPGISTKFDYSDIHNAHPLPPSPGLWVMVEITQRKSQFIALCIGKSNPCQVTYYENTREVQVTGEVIDSTGLFQYENILLAQIPQVPDTYFATVIMINGRVSPGLTEANVSLHMQNPICSKCFTIGGGCEGESKCVCTKNYFGRICNRYVKRITEETVKYVVSLKQFECMHVEDFYDEGEKETQFQLKAPSSPPSLLIINQHKDRDYSLAFREDRGFQTYLSVIDSWNQGTKEVSLTVDSDWMIATVMNLSPVQQNFEFTIFRIRDNTFNIISLVLYILLVVAIILLLGLSITVICLKARSNNRVGQEKKQEELGKIGDPEISKYLPLINKKGKPDSCLKEICSICLEANEGGKEVRKVGFCGHGFHSECLMDWIKEKEFCPNCKTDFSKKAIKEYEENLSSIELMKIIQKLN